MDIAINEQPTIIETILLNKIQALREQLIRSGINQGLDHESTILLSQKLDKYIFLYQSYEKNYH